jgi:HD domain
MIVVERARWPRRLAEALVVAVLWAILNRTASLFELRPGLSFFFPAAALTVVAGARLGLLGAASMALADFIAPWGAAVGFPGVALFALPATLWAAIVALLGRSADGTWARLRRFLLYGVVGGSLAAAVCGGSLLALMVGPLDWATLSNDIVGWWIPDLAAAISVGLALVVIFAPDALMDSTDAQLWREWLANGVEIGKVALAIVAGLGMTLALAQVSEATVHWLVVLLLPAFLLAGHRGGVGAALVTNALVSSIYTGVVTIGGLGLPGAPNNLFAVAYGNLGIFAAFALLAGVMGGRNRRHVTQVREQGRLLAEGLEDTVEALVAAISAKERGSDGHVERVARMSCLVGRGLGLDEDDLQVLRRAAILHDVGKIGVPETILNKPGGLDGEERDTMRRSIEIGAEIVDRVEFLKPVLEIVRYQKERWDGDRSARFAGRYGLCGAEIPLASRIIAAVEAYDSMTHERPYRAALSRESAVAELWRCSGGQFDPRVVAALTRVLREQWDLSDPTLVAVQ